MTTTTSRAAGNWHYEESIRGRGMVAGRQIEHLMRKCRTRRDRLGYRELLSPLGAALRIQAQGEHMAQQDSADSNLKGLRVMVIDDSRTIIDARRKPCLRARLRCRFGNRWVRGAVEDRSQSADHFRRYHDAATGRISDLCPDQERNV